MIRFKQNQRAGIACFIFGTTSTKAAFLPGLESIADLENNYSIAERQLWYVASIVMLIVNADNHADIKAHPKIYSLDAIAMENVCSYVLKRLFFYFLYNEGIANTKY